MKLVVNIEKRLRDFTLAANFTLTDTTLALLGASGSGKSMTLKCIAGLERPDRGQIVLNERILFDSEKGINLPPQARNVGYLFQNYALFPNMTVRENIIFALDGTREEKERIFKENVARFSLEGLENAYPAELSGGQQQRVAFARILARGADVLLLDEPLSALDTHLKWQIEIALREILAMQDISAILVTHDRDEAFRIAQEIATVDRGHLTTPMDKHELFRNPGTCAATTLTGCKNISAARRVDETHVTATDWGITLRVADATTNVRHIAVRAHYLVLASESDADALPARIAEVIESTFTYIVMLRFADGAMPIRWEIDKATWHAHEAGIGDTLHFNFPVEELMLLRD
ncbi:sulfate/molybdate ABC transporter ATP-binding protein [Selenomonas sp. oral taxon 138]|uniref:sulfate/molybdate ABC transporter ATP-binding protein n=1 Tax=Selenomonas sp. oral taxon 138 TaxID=712532 RepID=UPI0002A3D10F|nr:ATP-binding cassette domain-containing protein [Selenomonas sp. oral taxon 138]EKX99268.1 ABC transporter, ATP-binding protein [Selenomonas sp. oral taxon 138 str. F0429]